MRLPKQQLRRAIRRLAVASGLPAELDDLSRAIARLSGAGVTNGARVAPPGAPPPTPTAPTSYVDKGTQILLRLKYRELAAAGQVLPFDEIEFRNYSENGEDGILWYVFSLVGESSKTCVDIGSATGLSGNCANLIINHGWTGLLIDGNEQYVEFGRNFFANQPDTRIYPPKIVHAWVTAENVNDLLIDGGLSGEIDLLSLDIDGIDYWVLKALTTASPRVIIAEVQSIWRSEASVTVPYESDFVTQHVNGFGVYSGASLPAFVKLAKAKGYRLVGCQRYGYNAVFVRNDVGVDLLPEIPAEDCFRHPFTSWAHEVLLPHARDKAWVEV
jgi:hypothetical protein